MDSIDDSVMKHSSESRWWFYVACFIAIVVLESFPRFLFELSSPLRMLERSVLILLLLFVSWFFVHAEHGKMQWRVLSGLFFVDSVTAVVLALLLVFQLFSPWWLWATVVVLLLRGIVWSYTLAHRVEHLRGLVFLTCFALIIIGDIVMSFGLKLV